MERYVGALGPLVHSRVDPYNNLANSAHLVEQLRQIKFTHEPFKLPESDDESNDSDDDVPARHLGKGRSTKLKPHDRSLVASAHAARLTLANREVRVYNIP